MKRNKLEERIKKLVAQVEGGRIYGDYCKGSDKYKFLENSRWILKGIAEELGLDPVDVHINKAGPAVSGEATLIGMNPNGPKGLYIDFSHCYVFPDKFMWRTVNHMKDWTGGRNQWCAWAELETSLDKVLNRFRYLMGD